MQEHLSPNQSVIQPGLEQFQGWNIPRRMSFNFLQYIKKASHAGGVEPALVTTPLENGQASVFSPLIPKQGQDQIKDSKGSFPISPGRSSPRTFHNHPFLVMPCLLTCTQPSRKIFENSLQFGQSIILSHRLFSN